MKQNRTTLLLLGLVLVMGLAYVLLVRNRTDSTLNTSETDFAVRDTANIQYINLALYQMEKLSSSIALERTAKGWRVDKDYTVVPAQIELLLRTLHNLEVKQPVNAGYRETILKRMRNRQIRVEVRMADGSSKIIFVGGATHENTGTEMMLKGAQNPYVVEEPGFQGYLTPRFMPDLEAYREKILFDMPAEQLSQVSLSTPTGDIDFQLSRPNANQPWQLSPQASEAEPMALEAYTRQFGKIYARAFADADFPNAKDSLAKLRPDFTLTMTSFGGEKTEVYLFNRTDNVNEMFAWSNRDPRLLRVQHAVIDPFLRPRQQLLKQGRVKS